jgi:hypothetical protein
MIVGLRQPIGYLLVVTSYGYRKDPEGAAISRVKSILKRYILAQHVQVGVPQCP